MRTALVVLVACAVVARAEEPTAKQLMELASVAHKHAQETKDAKDYEKAASLYQQYFAKPDHPEEQSMSFYYAELLFHLQRYDEAANYYDRVVTVDPKGKFAADAAYGALVSRKNAIRSPNDPSKPMCPDERPCAIPDDLRRLVAAFDRYIAVVPNSPQRPTLEYRRARVYFEHNHFAEAAAQFDHIFTTYPELELATYSANLEMDCWALLKRYDELRALIERVKKSPAMKDAVTQKQVRDNEAALKKHGK